MSCGRRVKLPSFPEQHPWCCIRRCHREKFVNHRDIIFNSFALAWNLTFPAYLWLNRWPSKLPSSNSIPSRCFFRKLLSQMEFQHLVWYRSFQVSSWSRRLEQRWADCEIFQSESSPEPKKFNPTSRDRQIFWKSSVRFSPDPPIKNHAFLGGVYFAL